jgi:hypothetical protein
MTEMADGGDNDEGEVVYRKVTLSTFNMVMKGGGSSLTGERRACESVAMGSGAVGNADCQQHLKKKRRIGGGGGTTEGLITSETASLFRDTPFPILAGAEESNKNKTSYRKDREVVKGEKRWGEIVGSVRKKDSLSGWSSKVDPGRGWENSKELSSDGDERQ